MNQLQAFTFENSEIRLQTDENGNPWWVAKDICAVLGLKNAAQAIATLLESEKGVTIADTLGGIQEVSTVSESGLYKLIFKSRKPSAQKFQTWVTSDVLPSIRKTGSYSIQQKALSPAEALLQSVQMMVEHERKISKIDNRLIEIESRVMGAHHGQPMSALGFLRIKGLPNDSTTVMKFGRYATKVAKQLGFPVFTVPDTRFGKVNAFYQEFYEQVASEFFKTSNQGVSHVG